MRAVAAFLVLAWCAAASAEAMTPEQKQALHGTNMHHVGNLDPLPQNCLANFLKDLQQHETYVRLDKAIKGGHSVIYHFVEGKNPAIVKDLAKKHKLSVEATRQCKCQDCCGRILLPGGDVVEAQEVAGTRQERGGQSRKSKHNAQAAKTLEPASAPSMVAEAKEDARRIKIAGGKLTDDQKAWYYSMNQAQASKMEPKANVLVKKFLDDLREASPNTVLHLANPIPNGHTVRFRVVEGDQAPIQSLIGKCGLKIHGNTIIALDGNPRTAEADPESTDGHLHSEYREQSESGVPEKVQATDSPTYKRVTKLQDRWIKDAKQTARNGP